MKDKISEARKAIYSLIDKGYNIKDIIKVSKEIKKELKEEKDERYADYLMGRVN